MSGIFNRIKMIRAFLALVNDPRRTEMAFAISSTTRTEKSSPHVMATINHICDAEFKKLHAEWYDPEIPSLEELAKYPDGTLGREFARHMQTNGLEINFYTVEEGRSVEAYVVKRSRKSHDFWHVLTGFDVSVEDELGLQGFTLVQLASPLSGMLLAAGLLHCLLKNPSIYHKSVKQIVRGIRMGIASKPVLSFKFEDRLSVPVEKVREELGLVVPVNQGRLVS